MGRRLVAGSCSKAKLHQKGGAIWVVTPKGKEYSKGTDVIMAGKRYGLVVLKVVRHSQTHTASKLVIPLSKG